MVLEVSASAGPANRSSPSTSSPPPAFSVGKNIVLMPTFREYDVDLYSGTFERNANALQWSPEAPTSVQNSWES